VREGWEGGREVGWKGGIEGGRAFSRSPTNMAGWPKNLADSRLSRESARSGRE